MFTVHLVVSTSKKKDVFTKKNRQTYLSRTLSFFPIIVGRSLLAGHAEAGVPHPALPAVADVPGGGQAAGAVPVLVIAEAPQPRPGAQHPASPVVTNIIEVPGVTRDT